MFEENVGFTVFGHGADIVVASFIMLFVGLGLNNLPHDEQGWDRGQKIKGYGLLGLGLITVLVCLKEFSLLW